MTHIPPPSGSGQPANPGGAGAPPPVWPPQAKGFFGALFDFSFNHFITPSIIRALYVLGLIGIALSYLVFIVFWFQVGAVSGLISLLLGMIMSIVWVALWRVTLEFFLSVVRMSEDIHNSRFSGI